MKIDMFDVSLCITTLESALANLKPGETVDLINLTKDEILLIIVAFHIYANFGKDIKAFKCEMISLRENINKLLSERPTQ